MDKQYVKYPMVVTKAMPSGEPETMTVHSDEELAAAEKKGFQSKASQEGFEAAVASGTEPEQAEYVPKEFPKWIEGVLYEKAEDVPAGIIKAEAAARATSARDRLKAQQQAA